MSNGIDLAQPLTAATAGSVVKNAISHVGRYLNPGWKGLTLSEATIIKAAGLQIISIYEKASTDVSYFTTSEATVDANEGIKVAKQVGQPTNTGIYYTVDYDAQSKDFPAILTYFKTIRPILKAAGYKLGAYGSFAVLNFLHANDAADYYFQTVAWSQGQHCNFLNIYQVQCDKQNWNSTGLNVDLVNLEKADIGAWGQEMTRMNTQPATPVKNGWLKENNIWHFYKNGVLVKNDWAKDSKGLWYYLGDDGSMQVSKWVKWKNVWYFLKDDGSMAASDWIKWKDKWYYVKADGSMATGVIEDKGKLYYLGTDGAMIPSGRVSVSLSVSSDGSLHP